MHACPDCGIEHEQPAPPVEQIAATEARAEVKAVEAEGETAEAIARIDAETAIKLERERRKTIDAEVAAHIAALEAENETLRAAAAPPPAEPIVVDAGPPPAPADPAPDVPPPPEHAPAAMPKAESSKRSGYWSSYR